MITRIHGFIFLLHMSLACIIGLWGCATPVTHVLSSEQKLAFSSAKTFQVVLSNRFQFIDKQSSDSITKNMSHRLERSGRTIRNDNKQADLTVSVNKILVSYSSGYFSLNPNTMPGFGAKYVTGEEFKGFVRFSAPGVPAYEQTFKYGWGGPPPPPGYRVNLGSLRSERRGEDEIATLMRMLYEIDGRTHDQKNCEVECNKMFDNNQLKKGMDIDHCVQELCK